MADQDEPREGALLVGVTRAAQERRVELADEEDHFSDKAEEAIEVLEGILERMGLRIEVDVREDGEQIVLDVQGPDAGRAIGKKGQTLDALQFLVNKIVNRFPEERRYVVVDSGDYRERHDRSLAALARREARRAVEEGRIVTLQPMPPRDRRVVHMSLAKFSGVTTASEGEGAGRRIRIIPSSRSSRRDG